MAVIFPRWLNSLPTALAVGAPVALVAVTGAIWYWFSPRYTDVGYMPKQPVPFSHKLHAGDLGMDCRYCHFTAERSYFAAVPPTETCMNCHWKVRTDSLKLLRVRESYATSKPLEWIRVHNLPDYVYFNHSAHLASGVGCVSCHGRIDQMEVVRQDQPLTMGWCLDCHRDPAPSISAPAKVTDMTFMKDDSKSGKPAVASNGRTLNPPTHCSGCHR